MVWHWQWDGNGCNYKSSSYLSWHGNHAEQAKMTEHVINIFLMFIPLQQFWWNYMWDSLLLFSDMSLHQLYCCSAQRNWKCLNLVLFSTKSRGLCLRKHTELDRLWYSDDSDVCVRACVWVMGICSSYALAVFIYMFYFILWIWCTDWIALQNLVPSDYQDIF